MRYGSRYQRDRPGERTGIVIPEACRWKEATLRTLRWKLLRRSSVLLTAAIASLSSTLALGTLLRLEYLFSLCEKLRRGLRAWLAILRDCMCGVLVVTLTHVRNVLSRLPASPSSALAILAVRFCYGHREEPDDHASLLCPCIWT